jgi:hypothetical protein
MQYLAPVDLDSWTPMGCVTDRWGIGESQGSIVKTATPFQVMV